MYPQLIMIGIVFLGLGVSLAQHGEPKTGKENVFVTLFAILITQSILYWGGFYDVIITTIR